MLACAENGNGRDKPGHDDVKTARIKVDEKSYGTIDIAAADSTGRLAASAIAIVRPLARQP